MHDQALGANIQTHIRAWTIRLFKTIMPPAHAPDASCANVSEHAEFVCEAAQCCPSSSAAPSWEEVCTAPRRFAPRLAGGRVHRAAAVVGPRHVPCIWLVNQGAYIWLACQRRAKGKKKRLFLHVVWRPLMVTDGRDCSVCSDALERESARRMSGLTSTSNLRRARSMEASGLPAATSASAT